MAPEALKVKDCPLQIEPLLTATVGRATAVTEATAVLEETQPAELVPVTEYEDVPLGITVALPLL